MTELERELRDLGRELAYPAAPDLVAGVRARIAGSTPRRLLLPPRRTLAVAFAALVIAVAIAFAVPPARSAILHAFGIGGVHIELVDRLPERPLGGARVIGERVSLARARSLVDFPVRVPTREGFEHPDAVVVGDAVPGGVLFLVYGPEDSPRALLTEFAADGVEFAEKSVGPGTTVQRVDVDGARGAWISGAPHQFTFRNRNGQTQVGWLRLATNTLVWVRDGVTYRLEGMLTQQEAISIAASVR